VRRAIDAALNFLSYRQRTGREVRRKLVDRGFSEEAIEATMRRLGAVGLVDDEAFVGAYVRDRIAHRPMDVRRMVQDLYAKGIAREVSAPVIEEVLTLRSRSQNEAVLRRRLRDHLIRRGFDTRVVSEVVDELFSGDAAS
jgi:regulatory protein